MILRPVPYRLRARTSRRGLSLIEAMIAIVMIGILAVVAFQSLSTYRQLVEEDGAKRTAIQLAEEAIDVAVHTGWTANDPSTFGGALQVSDLSGISYTLEKFPTGVENSTNPDVISQFRRVEGRRYRVQRSGIQVVTPVETVRIVRITVTWDMRGADDTYASWVSEYLEPVELTYVILP